MTADYYARLTEIELRVARFLVRTGLPLSEVALVEFRGKAFPQWKGATAAIPSAAISPD